MRSLEDRKLREVKKRLLALLGEVERLNLYFDHHFPKALLVRQRKKRKK